MKEYVSELVEDMMKSGRFKDDGVLAPKAEIRLTVDKMPLTEDNLDFYSFFPKLYDSLKKVNSGYSKELKIQAFSMDTEFGLSELGSINMDSYFLSVISRKYIARYKNMAQLSMNLTRTLRHLGMLGEDDILTISEKGEYVLVTRMNIRMLLRHLKPTLFGLLILLALGDRITSVTHSSCMKHKSDYGFKYFMAVACFTWKELDRYMPVRKKAFDDRYKSMTEILIDMGIAGNQYSTGSTSTIRVSDLDLESEYERHMVKKASRDDQREVNRNDKLNEEFATSSLMLDEIPYNPRISKEQRIFNKTGVNLGGAVKETPRHSAKNSEFRRMMESYRDRIVKSD